MGRIRDFLEAISPRLSAARSRAEAFMEEMGVSPRDKRFLKIGAVVLSVFLLFMAYRAIAPDSPGLRSELRLLKAQFGEVKALKDEYRYSSDLLRRVSGSMKEEEEALISVVERTLVGNQIGRESFSIRGTNPSSDISDVVEGERVVIVQINSIPLSSLIDVLYSFQNGGSILKVSDLTIKTRFDDPSLTDVSFRLSTFSFREAG